MTLGKLLSFHPKMGIIIALSGLSDWMNVEWRKCLTQAKEDLVAHHIQGNCSPEAKGNKTCHIAGKWDSRTQVGLMSLYPLTLIAT